MRRKEYELKYGDVIPFEKWMEHFCLYIDEHLGEGKGVDIKVYYQKSPHCIIVEKRNVFNNPYKSSVTLAGTLKGIEKALESLEKYKVKLKEKSK